MDVLLVGSGGREHALAWKLAQSEALGVLHAAPGNPGIARLATCHPVRPEDGEGLLSLCREHAIDLVVVGPEAPLVAGVADVLRHGGIPVFGPGAAAARIEASKSFAKDVMRAAGVATAAALEEPRAPCVVKADGLAGGKGVFVCRTQAEADDAVARARRYGSDIVVEELLEGREASLFGLTDGARAVALPVARDAKRLLDGDEGPNTGGMGAYSPVPDVDDEAAAELVEAVHRPVLEELARRGTPIVGLLYAGLMLTDEGPRVLEFNCRFGDPETQAIVPRLAGDLLEPLARAAVGDLPDYSSLAAADEAAVTVVVASGGYPDRPVAGGRITGIDEAEARGAIVFHAGTALRDGALVSAGGRVVGVTALGETLADARARAYEAVDAISLDDAHIRRDLAAEAVHAAG